MALGARPAAVLALMAATVAVGAVVYDAASQGRFVPAWAGIAVFSAGAALLFAFGRGRMASTAGIVLAGLCALYGAADAIVVLVTYPHRALAIVGTRVAPTAIVAAVVALLGTAAVLLRVLPGRAPQSPEAP